MLEEGYSPPSQLLTAGLYTTFVCSNSYFQQHKWSIALVNEQVYIVSKSTNYVELRHFCD